MSTPNSWGGSTLMWKSTASPGETAPVEAKPLICPRTSSADRGPEVRVRRPEGWRGAGTAAVRVEPCGPPAARNSASSAAGSTYQGTTWPVSPK